MPKVDQQTSSRRVRRRVLTILVLTFAVIYWFVSAFDLGAGQLRDYLFASGLLVLASALTGLLLVAVVKFFQR